MQAIQNTTARAVLNKESYNTSTTECLKTLHWLLIKEIINYKISNLGHKLLHGKGPKYL